jgi:putative endonuclease
VRDGFYYKFWVYILSSRSGTLYVGITGYFDRRIHQHKYDSIEGFTKKYQCHRLVYYESYQDVQVAISREKQIKRWRREKKIGLIEKMNPRWQIWRRIGDGKCGSGDSPWVKRPDQHRGVSILGIFRRALIPHAGLVLAQDDKCLGVLLMIADWKAGSLRLFAASCQRAIAQ